MDKTAKIWDTATGVCLYTLSDPLHAISSAAFNHDDNLIVTVANPGTIYTWNVATGSRINTIEEGKAIASVEFNSDSSRMLIAVDGMILIWDTKNSIFLYIYEATPPTIFYSAKFSPDCSCIATTSRDHKIRILATSQWHATGTDRCLHILGGHTGTVNSVNFSPNGLCIATSSDDGTARIYRSSVGWCHNVLVDIFATTICIAARLVLYAKYGHTKPYCIGNIVLNALEAVHCLRSHVYHELPNIFVDSCYNAGCLASIENYINDNTGISMTGISNNWYYFSGWLLARFLLNQTAWSIYSIPRYFDNNWILTKLDRKLSFPIARLRWWNKCLTSALGVNQD